MAAARAEDQVFFIYDHTILQREEDDPKNAILYFFPSSISVDDQCALCGQLMGMARFFRSTMQTSPSLYVLKRNKVAVKHMGKYTMALSGNRQEPHAVVLGQLACLQNLFVFYQRSMDHLEKHCENTDTSTTAFIQDVWDCYLPFVRRYGDSIAAAFQSLPTVELPEPGCMLFLKASHLLQHSQRQTGVIAGAIIYRNRVLCSQLPPEITSRMLILRPQQSHFPSHSIDTDCNLPAGVRLLRVYVTKDEYCQLCKANRWLSTQRSKVKPRTDINQDVNSIGGKESMTSPLRVEVNNEGPAAVELDVKCTSPEPHSPQWLSSGSGMTKSTSHPNFQELQLSPISERSIKDKSINRSYDSHSPQKLERRISIEQVHNQSNVVSVSDASICEEVEAEEEVLGDTMDDHQQRMVRSQTVPTLPVHHTNFIPTLPTLHSDVSPTQPALHPETVPSQSTIHPDAILHTSTNAIHNHTPVEAGGKRIQSQTAANSTASLFRKVKQIAEQNKNIMEDINKHLSLATADSDSDEEGVTGVPLTSRSRRLYQPAIGIGNADSATDKYPSLKLTQHAPPEVSTSLKGNVDTTDRNLVPTQNNARTVHGGDVQSAVQSNLSKAERETWTPDQSCASPTSPPATVRPVADTVQDTQPVISDLPPDSPNVPSTRSSDDMTHLDLYIQGNSDTILLLLLQAGTGRDAQFISNQWRTGLPLLADLEVQLKQMADPLTKVKDSILKYNYLTFNTYTRHLSGKISMAHGMLQPMSAQELDFCGTAVKIHKEFGEMGSLADVTLRGHNTCIYGHRTLSQQVFFQPKETKPSSGAPSVRDNAMCLDTKACHKLLKEQGINII